MRHGYLPGKKHFLCRLHQMPDGILPFLVFFMPFLLSLHVLPIYNLASGLVRVCVFKLVLSDLTWLTDERFKAFISANMEPDSTGKECAIFFLNAILLIWLGYK